MERASRYVPAGGRRARDPRAGVLRRDAGERVSRFASAAVSDARSDAAAASVAGAQAGAARGAAWLRYRLALPLAGLHDASVHPDRIVDRGRQARSAVPPIAGPEHLSRGGVMVDTVHAAPRGRIAQLI